MACRNCQQSKDHDRLGQQAASWYDDDEFAHDVADDLSGFDLGAFQGMDHASGIVPPLGGGLLEASGLSAAGLGRGLGSSRLVAPPSAAPG